MATATGTWSSVGSTDGNQCYCTEACSFTLSMCGSAVEAITNTPYDWTESEIDEMYNDCDVVHDGCIDECNGESGYDAFSSRKPKSSSNRSPKSKQREHHYTFDVDDNSLDINGFVVHTAKHKGKKHKFRVYLDSNENGRFDKNDELIARSGLKQKYASKGVGNLLDEDEIGQFEVKVKKPKSNASMKTPEISDLAEWNDDSKNNTSAQSIGGGGGAGGSVIYSMSFRGSDGDSMAQINKDGNISKAAWDIGLENM